MSFKDIWHPFVIFIINLWDLQIALVLRAYAIFFYLWINHWGSPLRLSKSKLHSKSYDYLEKVYQIELNRVQKSINLKLITEIKFEIYPLTYRCFERRTNKNKPTAPWNASCFVLNKRYIAWEETIPCWTRDMLVTPVSIKNVHAEGEKAYDRKENEDGNG